MNENDRQVFDQIGSWATQTIAFALSIRAQNAGRPFKDANTSLHATIEAERRRNLLWEQCSKEFSTTPQSGKLVFMFTQTVFDWCYAHMNQPVS